MDGTYFVKTSVGTFRIHHEKAYDYQQKYKNDFLRIGGKNNCVEYSWDIKNPSEVYLQWLDVDRGGCEITNKQIRGSNTIHMFDLSVSILRKYTPVSIIELMDNSKFPCILPNEKRVSIHMNSYYYLFHNGTWYDTKLGAYPKDTIEKERYEGNKFRAADPDSKSAQFNFRNDDLNKDFEPLFDSSTTWREFLDKIYTKYRSNTLCARIYPWYLEATSQLTGGLSLPTMWIIEADKRPDVAFELVSSGGSRRMTMKRRYSVADEIGPSEILTLPYN
jgi:hypothetical protein